MIKLIYSIVAISICILLNTASAQSANTKFPDSLNAEMQKIAKPGSEAGFIRFKADLKADPMTLFTEYKSAFGLSGDDQMSLYKTESDDLGFSHFRFQQFYKNIKVEASTIIVHKNNQGEVYAANGKISTQLNMDVIPVLSADVAIDKALKKINAKEYKWQSVFWEKEIKTRTGKTDTSYYPSAELVIRAIKNKEVNTDVPAVQYYLVYRIDIYSSQPNYAQRLFVDAKTGNILLSLPLQSGIESEN